MNSSSLGKKVLISIIIASIAIDILSIISIVWALSSAGRADEIPHKLMPEIVRLILLSVIMVALYKGRPVAKWLSAFLLLLSGIGGLLAVSKVFSIYLLMIGAIYTISGLLLIFFKPIDAFMEYQRTNS